jgi:hypothetical protein
MVPESERRINMSNLFGRIFGLVAVAGLMAAGSQAAVQARFHLPVATHWGATLLAPGDYKIRILDQTSGRNQVVIEGFGHTTYEMPIAVDMQLTSSPSSLQLVEVGGSYFVKEYRSAFVGRTYTFGVPKQIASHRSKTIEIAN